MLFYKEILRTLLLQLKEQIQNYSHALTREQNE